MGRHGAVRELRPRAVSRQNRAIKRLDRAFRSRSREIRKRHQIDN